MWRSSFGLCSNLGHRKAKSNKLVLIERKVRLCGSDHQEILHIARSAPFLTGITSCMPQIGSALKRIPMQSKLRLEAAFTSLGGWLLRVSKTQSIAPTFFIGPNTRAAFLMQKKDRIVYSQREEGEQMKGHSGARATPATGDRSSKHKNTLSRRCWVKYRRSCTSRFAVHGPLVITINIVLIDRVALYPFSAGVRATNGREAKIGWRINQFPTGQRSTGPIAPRRIVA